MVEPADVDGAVVGQQPDGRLGVHRLVVDPVEHPRQHPAVVAEAGPQELAVGVLAEPVDVEDLRQLGARPGGRSRASGSSSRPCCSRRTAAWRTGRGAGCRPRRRPRRSSRSAMIEPRNTPCSQSKASVTSGTTVARRPPKRMAEIGTPLGSSHSGAMTGHCEAGAVKRALGWAAGRARTRASSRCPASRWRGRACPSVMPSHHTSPSSVRAMLVKMQLLVEREAWRWGWCPSRCPGRRRRSRPRG